MEKNENIETFNYYSYTFHSNGKVYSKSGKKVITPYKYENGVNYVILLIPTEDKNNKGNIKSKRVKVRVARKLYELFYNIELEKDDIVDYKDNDPDNCDISNLYVRKECKKSYLTVEQIMEIRNLYMNQDKHMKNHVKKDSYSIRELANVYNVSTTVIQNVINKLDLMVPLIVIRIGELEHIVGHHSNCKLCISSNKKELFLKDEVFNGNSFINEEMEFVNVLSEKDIYVEYIPLELYQYLLLKVDSVSKRGVIKKEIDKWYYGIRGE